MNAVSLGLTASSGPGSVAIRLGDGTVHAMPKPSRGDDLAATVAEAFASVGETPTALREVRLDLGPGSYTGLRIATTFARTLHVFQRIPVLTVTSAQLMALAAWRQGSVAASRLVRPVLDARRNRFHHALVELSSGVRFRETPRAVEREELLESIGPQEVLLADETLHPMLLDAVQRTGASLVSALPFGADLLFDEQLQLTPSSGGQLEPLYLMGSYAE